MSALFVGGPYDGKVIEMEAINRCCRLHHVEATPPRLFLSMPPIELWERIESGELTKEKASGTFWAYERFRINGKLEFHEAGENGRFEAALRGEHPDPLDVFGSHEELLAYRLESKLVDELAKVPDLVVPPGQLGGGMSFSFKTESNRQYDPNSNEIVLQGVVTIKLKRNPSPDA